MNTFSAHFKSMHNKIQAFKKLSVAEQSLLKSTKINFFEQNLISIYHIQLNLNQAHYHR